MKRWRKKEKPGGQEGKEKQEDEGEVGISKEEQGGTGKSRTRNFMENAPWEDLHALKD